MTPRWVMALAAAAGVAATTPATAADTRFTTLGTAGGPVIRPDRSQPANLLTTAAGRYLVDVGDGAIERLAAKGLQPRQIDGVFISHLHVDHVGGLQGLIGIRWMLGASGPLVIYGPPGTPELVNGIIASLAPSARIGLGFGKGEGSGGRPLADTVRVVVLHDGDRIRVGAMRVAAKRNTHFTETPDGATGEPVSLSYRFDCGDRSIGYTGDTGPSDALSPFFKDVDLLVSEVIDLVGVIADSRRANTQLGVAGEHALEAHLAAHHLTAEAAGRLATAAAARSLVLTHLAISGPTADSEPAVVAGVHRAYAGTVAVAHDLQEF